jgi:hypothetical protein
MNVRALAFLSSVLLAGTLSSGLETIERFENYPLLMSDTQAHYLSSYDRSGGNDDGFNGTYSALYVDDNGEHVIFDVKGSGTVYTLWFTSRVSGFSPLDVGRIRFYFDDETKPRIDMDIDEFFSGKHAPFVPPFVYNPFTSSGGHVSYLPFPFQKRLKITTETRAGFYNLYYHTYSPDRRVESWTGNEDLSNIERLWKQVGEDPKPRKDEVVFSGTLAVPAPSLPDGEPVPGAATVLEHTGAGAITSLRMNPLFPLTAYQLNHIYLRAYWDGETAPSVDAPLGSFFGSGLGEASVRSVPVGMSPSSHYYCYFPMPFWEKFKVELVNENPQPTPEIWWEMRVTPTSVYEYPRDRSGTFHARYRKEWPTTPDRDFTILETEGRGIYVGQVMTVEPLRPEVKRWWEGDLRIYIDGRRQPAFHGTGHEDEYLGGWSNEWLMNPYSLPMHGQPKTDQLTQVDFQWSAATTVYRFFVGGIPYQSRLSISTEHGAENSAEAMYSSVAFYYEHPHVMQRLDAVDVASSDDEKAHAYRTTPASKVTRLVSRFEGEADDSDLTDEGRDVTGRSSWAFEAPGDSSPLRLRRLYDQGTVQEAEVWVNGELAGVWYTVATNSHRRWAESDFLLPISLTAGESRLEIEIRVLQGPWSEYRYELWGVPASAAE